MHIANKMKKLIALSTSLVYLAPLLVMAQDAPNTGINSVGDVKGLLCNIFGWVFTFFVIIAIFFVLYAGFKYLTAGGEEEKVHEANRTLIYAVVAIVVALLARSVPLIIANFVGGGGASGVS